MGPGGKDGPPGLQGLRVSNMSFPSDPQLTLTGPPHQRLRQRAWCQPTELEMNTGSRLKG